MAAVVVVLVVVVRLGRVQVSSRSFFPRPVGPVLVAPLPIPYRRYAFSALSREIHACIGERAGCARVALTSPDASGNLTLSTDGPELFSFDRPLTTICPRRKVYPL